MNETIPIGKFKYTKPEGKMTTEDRMLLECALYAWRDLLGTRHRFTFVQRKYIEIKHREYYETP